MGIGQDCYVIVSNGWIIGTYVIVIKMYWKMCKKNVSFPEEPFFLITFDVKDSLRQGLTFCNFDL